MLDFNINTSSVNKVNAKVELYNGSTLVETCTCNDRLQDFTVERIGLNNKFFGFGIIHKITISLIDLERTLDVTKDNSFKAFFGYDDFISPYPTFHVAEATRDETTNTITIVAYDKLYTASSHTVAEITAPYTLESFIGAAVPLLGVTNVRIKGVYDNIFETSYPSGGNFEGTESLKDGLNAVAEVTQTIYFLNNADELVFKRLDKSGDPVLTITKEDYYELESGETKVLAAITDTNELGNDTSVEVDGVTGVIQYVRDNPFWELREDIQTLLARAGTAIGGIAATPFYCDWDGNFLLEIGDKIGIIAEDNSELTSYLLNDTVRYDGLLAEATQFIHDGTVETASNPLSLGEKLKQTYAKVDKQNKQIELVVSDVSQNKSDIASLTLDVNGIKLAIESLEDASVGDLTRLTERITQLELNDQSITASVTEMQTSVETVETALGTMETELGVVESGLGTLTGTVEGHTTSLSGLKSDLNTTNNNISSLETTLGGINDDLENINEGIKTLSNELSVIEGSLDTLSGTVSTNSTKIGELVTTTESISARVTAEETKSTQLTNDLNTTNTTITEHSTKIGELVTTTDSISASVSSIQTNVTTLQTTTTTLGEDITATNLVVTSNTEAIGTLTATTEAISANVTDLETTTSELKTTTETLDGEIKTVSSKVSTNETAIGQLQVTTEAISAEVSSVKEDTQELATSVTTLEGTVATNTTAISTNTTNINSINTTLSGIELSVSTLKTTTQTHASYINNINSDITEINGDITEIKTTNTTQSEKIAALELTDESISASVSSLEQTTETHTKTISDYNDRFITNEDDIANLQTDTIELENAMEQANIAISTNIEKIAALELTDESITASVSTLETKTQTQIGGLEENYTTLSEQVSELKLTDSALTLDIKNIQDNGVDKVTTSTGFTFNDEGLTIEKSDSDISTNINEDGLSVYKYNDEVLTADNQGVKAQNLTAREYLIIGTNTYITDYTDENGNSRAGVFWNGD